MPANHTTTAIAAPSQVLLQIRMARNKLASMLKCFFIYNMHITKNNRLSVNSHPLGAPVIINTRARSAFACCSWEFYKLPEANKEENKDASQNSSGRKAHKNWKDGRRHQTLGQPDLSSVRRKAVVAPDCLAARHLQSSAHEVQQYRSDWLLHSQIE